MTKVAVVGASGFIGARACEMLLLKGWADVVPVVKSYASAARIARLPYDVRFADALDEDQLTRALAGCDVVFHTIVGDEGTILAAPGVAARAAARAGVRRIVYLSSGMVYGFTPGEDANDETRPVVAQPRGYNRSKALAEVRIARLRKQPGVDIVVLRPTIVYGPRSLQFTVRLAQELLSGSAYLVDGGSGVCNAVYVDNLVTAMWKAARSPGAANENFIVSDAERTTWWDLYASVATAVGVSTDTIASVPAEVARDYAKPATTGPRLEGLLRGRLTSPLRAALSEGAKSRVKAIILALEREAENGHVERPRPFDAETLNLQMCSAQLPILKAQRSLGYTPLPRQEGFRRTGAWLRDVGFSLSP